MRNILVFAILLFSNIILAQKQIKGMVTNEVEERLPFATIQWKNTKSLVTADDNGNFVISARKKTDTLLVTYTGYEPAEVVVEPHETMLWIEVKGIKQLQEAVVTASRPDNFVSTLEKRHIEQISSCELRKAPCCNLAGSFETNGSVDINYPNAVTGANEIQMLGLRGIYTQVTLQKRPAFYGLAYPFALEFYSGSWLDGISISKGASSVEQGAQSLTGQINVDLVKPFEDKALFVNLYQNSLGTFETNVHLNKKFDDTWSANILFHGDYNNNPWDHDYDGFLNMPLKKQLNALTQIVHRGQKFYSRFNIHALQDQRAGGQIALAQGQKEGLWKVKQDMTRLDFSGSLGFLGFKNPYTTAALIYGLTMHKTDELYGKNTHAGTQNSIYSNFIYQTILGDTKHYLKTGASFQLDDYKEKVNDVILDRKDIMPGIFAEYDYSRPVLGEDYTDWGFIFGLRADRHQKFGNFISPRMNLKYNFSQNTIVRASAGRGWRVANIIPENLSVLASNKNIFIPNNLKPEDGWNVGTNFSTRLDFFGKNASWSGDVYYTQFKNQIVVDFDKSIKNVSFYNLEGKSYAASFMTVLSFPISKNFDVKMSYKYNDVKVSYLDGLKTPPLFANHRGLLTLDARTNDKTWLFHITNNFIGKQRLPENRDLPTSYHSEYHQSSPAYININAQITKLIGRRWEVYFGGENLTNFTQHHPILASQEPYSQYFDASQVWGPIMGIRGFVGVRYSIAQNEAKPLKMLPFTDLTKAKTANFEVKGECGMCKTRIEKAALQDGVFSAVWSSETKILNIKYDEKITSAEKIQEKIAKAGHETGGLKPSQKTYDNLPACCQYTKE
jgi:outer membrane receptor for ferrienterochelin and colicins